MTASVPEGQPTVMEGTDPTAPPATPEPPKPSETVDFWKTKAREQEKRAKENAEARRRLDEFEEAQKTESQKASEKAEKAQREAEQLRAENVRYKAAAIHGISEDNFDLLGTGTEEEILARAERLGTLEKTVKETGALKAENEQLKAQIAQMQGKPGVIPSLTPGVAPAEDHSYPPSWFPQLNRPPIDNNS